MPDNIPSNPFERPRDNQDPRASKLFASTSSQTRTPLTQEQRAPIPEAKPKPRDSRPVMSARREVRMKHSIVRRNILISISVVIGIILALIATDTLKLGTGPRPSLSDSSQSLNRTIRRPTRVAG